MLKTLWRRFLADRVSSSIEARLMSRPHGVSVQQSIAETASLRERLEQLESKMAVTLDPKPWRRNLHIPDLRIHPPMTDAFMNYSTVSASDFYHPMFRELSLQMGIAPMLHRKLWEYVYVLHHAQRLGAIGKGRRALGFAVGTEPLPSAFAALGTQVVATDAPIELGEEKGWRLGNQHASGLAETHKPELIDWDAYQKLASAQPCDMTKIDPALTGFDFCWSCCSFEHLGDIAAGLRFVEESVEKTLVPGGVAIHTTEFNLSSDDATIESGATVIYRLKDMLAFAERLRSRGHQVEAIRVAPDAHVLDFFLDTPPYDAPVHLKLQLMGYTSTSIGLIITRGA